MTRTLLDEEAAKSSDARRERRVRRWARGLGTAFVVILLLFAIGESLGPAPEESPVEMRWYEWFGLVMMGVGVVGFVAAWWRPLEGGILGLLGLATPIVQSLLYVAGPLELWYMIISPINLGIVAGVFHLLDARWRRRGVGPPIGRIRERAVSE